MPPNARTAAVRVLGRVLDSGQMLDEALAPATRDLSPEDRAFCRAIVMSSLRHKGSIEFLISKYLSRALPKSGRVAHLLLLSGAAQLLFVGSPAHAVVNEQVSMLPEKSKFRGVVNAVLRRFDRQGHDDIKDPKVRQRDLPVWLWHRWKAAWGAEPVMDIIRTMGQDEVPLDITVKQDPAGWAERLGGTSIAGQTVRLARATSVTRIEGYDEGHWWVQDIGASLPARILGDVTGRKVLDACAAPGGKTAQLAVAGADVTALDRSARRLKRLDENMTRLGLTVEAVAEDLLLHRPAAVYDAVLLDAPCSATGTLRRHPDIGWNRGEEDVSSLVQLQADMLDSASALLKPGGTLVYCTCSLEKDEGEQQIENLLVRTDAFRRDRIRANEVGLGTDVVNGKGELRTLPNHLADQGGMDGFFAARLIRN
jgi:16S rRNA (cytosine967-C5)-methyltransferase